MDIADESSRSPLGNTSISEKKRSKIRLNKKKPKFWMENIIWIYLRLMNHPVHLWEKTSNSEKSIKFRINNKKIDFFL